MEEKLQKTADELTGIIMSYVYGERFDKSDDITEDEELNKAWEFFNETTFVSLWATWDEAIASEHEEI